MPSEALSLQQPGKPLTASIRGGRGSGDPAGGARSAAGGLRRPVRPTALAPPPLASAPASDAACCSCAARRLATLSRSTTVSTRPPGHSSRWAVFSDRRRCVSGHFPADFDGFRPEPPDANLEPDYAERFKLAGYNKIQQEEHHEFFKRWTTEDKFPRFLCVEIQHACPYFDDSCKRRKFERRCQSSASSMSLHRCLEETEISSLL